MATAIIIYLIA